MKSFRPSFSLWSALRRLRLYAGRARYIWLTVVWIALGGIQQANGQSDDFNDGNDNGWVRFGLDSAGLPPATYGFPDDGFGGKARSEERRVGKECRSRWSPYH